jgi:endonuclease III related protein
VKNSQNNFHALCLPGLVLTLTEPWIMVGAVLTQNTNWGNVVKALGVIRREGLLAPEALYALSEDRLAELVRPAGYFRVKASRLKNLLVFLKNEYAFDLEAMAGEEVRHLRDKLLLVKGVGPETADSILLYALELPSFVVDAYTRRICNRHGLLPEDVEYEELREYFMDVLPEDVQLYNEYHALLVRTAQGWCGKKAPLCDTCPLHAFLS